MAKKSVAIIATILLCVFCAFSLIGVVSFSLVEKNINYEADEMLFKSAQNDASAVYYAYNEYGELEEYYTDRSTDYKEWCSFDEIGEYIKLGFISAEDRKFYSHSGVNIRRTAAAFINHILHFDSKFGASTITQQVIKNISGDNEFTVRRKVAEILRALHIENRHSKDEIFELYLNIVPMSNNIYGVGAASEYYFGKSPDELTLAESALLVGITNAPTRFDPVRNPEASLEKRNNVLYAMLDNGAISRDEFDSARKESLSLSISDVKNAIAPWFVETANDDILADLTKRYSVTEQSARLMLRGSKIILTLDKRVQGILDECFSDSNALAPAYSSGLNYGMIVYSNDTGDISGIVGGAGEKRANRLLNLATVNITPGSTLKPLALYAPILDEEKLNSASLIKDLPLYYRETTSGIVGYPRNSPDVYSGAVTVADAVAFSKNTCAAEIYNMLGNKKIMTNLIDNYGFTLKDEDAYLAPLALGQLTGGVSLRELTRGYSSFSNDGIIRKGRTYIGVFGKDGTVLIDNSSSEKRVMKTETARIMNSLLEGVVDFGTARSINLKNLIDTAGKTGTSGGDKDRLFVGYTPYYTAGIWTGYPDGSMSVGNNQPSHLKIWDDIMTRIHEECVFTTKEDVASFSREGLYEISFNCENGDMWCYECQDELKNIRIGYFTESNMPKVYCEIHGKTENYIPAQMER